MQEKNLTFGKFSLRLRELMETSGMKQNEIATKLGFTSTALVHWKSGRSIPGGIELYTLAKFFGCSMEWLLTGEDDDGKPNQAVAIYKERADVAEKRLEDLKKSLIGVIKKL